MIMASSNAIQKTENITNGVNVDQVLAVIDAIEDDPGFAKWQIRANNNWINGGLNRSRIKDFSVGGREDDTRTETFVLDSDEPLPMSGKDSAPNAMEFVLHALTSCLTSTLVYHAAVRGIEVEAIESHLEGDMDVRGLLGLSDEVRKGYNKVRVNMRVKSAASAEELTELAMFSPVHDIVSQSLPVEFTLETY
jgi:uncharacterized OsmC-like protein